MKRTYVYVDAFNLYYGCLKGTAHRWLNLQEFCRLMLPVNEVLAIKYFTAHVSARPTDPSQPLRQQIYLRALATVGVQIIYGHYLRHRVQMPLADPVPGKNKYVTVIKTEEKGSDVNLATHLVSDGYEERYDTAVLITNDSDLLGPLQLVTTRLKKQVGILNPHKYPAFVLKSAATFFKQIRAGVLTASQFPEKLADANGEFHKPIEW
jgi:hypothetical protein